MNQISQWVENTCKSSVNLMGRGAIFTLGRNTTSSTERRANDGTGSGGEKHNPAKRTKPPSLTGEKREEGRKK
jgi:hypothetical protein